MVKVEYFTTSQINALPTIPGRLVFDTDIGKLKINDGAFYKIITDAAATVNTAGNVGINTSALDYALEVNSTTGSNLRLTYNNNVGTATNYCNLFTTSTGNLSITPSGGFVNITTHNGLNQGLSLNNVLITSTATQLNFLSGVTPGTASISKALVLDSSGNIATINSITATSIIGTLQTGSQPNITSIGNLSSLTVTGTLSTVGLTLNGGSVTASASDINQLTGLTAGTITGGKVVIVDSNKDISGFRNITVTGSISGITTLSTTNFTLNSTSVTATGSQLNFLSGVTAGTATISKALVLDSSGNIATINSLTATSLTGTLQTPAQTNITSVGTLTNLSVSGTTSTTGLTLNSISITATGTQLNYLSGVTPGTVLASKAVVVDSNKDITSIHNITTVLGTISGLLNVNTISLSLNNVSVDAIATEINRLAGLTVGIASASKVLTVDQFYNLTGVNSLSATFLSGSIITNSQPNITTVGTLGSLTVSGNVFLTGHNGSSVGLVLNGVLVISTASELNLVSGITAGTVLASKALVVDSNKDLSSLRNLTLTGTLSTTLLTLNSVSVTSSAAELNYNASVTAGSVLANKTLVVDSNKDLSSLRNLTLTGTLSTTSLTLNNISVTANANEINTLSGITPGSVSAGKLLVVDSNKDLATIRNLSLIKLQIIGGTSGVVSISSITGTWNLSLPTTAGTNGYVLQTDGSGNTSWVSPGSTLSDITDATGVSLTLSPTTYATSISNACLIVNGGTGIAKNIKIGGTGLSLSSWLTNGCQYDSIATTFTDSGTAGTRTSAVITSFGTPTLAATNSVTITNSATIYIANAPTAGTNVILTNKYALWIAAGNVFMDAGTASTTTTSGTLVITGGLGVSGQVTATNLSGLLTTAAQTNITSVGTLTGLTMGGTLAMGTNNITGTGNIGGTLTTAVQTNITSVGNLTGLTMNGTLAMGTNNITGTGNIGGTLTTAVQTNITSVGNLTGLTMNGTLAMGTNNITGTGNIGGTLTTAIQTGITSVGTLTSLTMSGALSGVTTLGASGVVTLTNSTLSSSASTGGLILSGGLTIAKNVYIGSTSISTTAWGLTGIQYVSLATTFTDTSSSGTVASATITSFAQPTIAASSTTTFTNSATIYIANAPTAGTNVTLTNPYALWVGSGNVLFAGNLNVSGTIGGLLSTAAQTNITSVGILTGLTMGGVLAMGTNNITGTGTIGGTLTTAAQNNITSVGTLTGLTMGGVLAMGTNNITGTGTIGGTLTTAAQTGITSVGTLTGLTMGGTLSMGTNNITGTGNIGGTLTTAAQTGITSVGTLTGLTMGGVLAMGTNNITGTGTIGGTLTTAIQTGITSVGTLTGLTMGGVLAMGTNNITGTGTIGGTLTTAAQTGITSLGTLTGLTMGGTLAMGTNNITGTGNIGGTLTTAVQTGITSVGTLTGLSSSGVVTFTNTTQSSSISTGGLVLSGGLAIAKNVYIGSTAVSSTVWGLTGIQYVSLATTYTDTSSSGTVSSVAISAYAQPTIAASSATTFTNSATLFISNSPAAGTNVTLTNPYALWVAGGNVLFAATLTVASIITSQSTTLSTSASTGGIVTTGGIGIGRNMYIGGTSISTTAWGLTGIQHVSLATTFTDTSSSGTVASATITSFAQPTIAALSVTTFTNSATIYIANSPAAGTNVTLTNSYALWVGSGNVLFAGNLNVSGTIGGLLSTAAQTNITSVGTLTGLTMGGTLAMGTNNITGTGNIGGTLTTAAQTGITSVGTLTSLTMGGTLAMGTNNITGTGNIGGTLTTAAQTNITSVGTLTGLTMGGTLAMGTNNITGTGNIGGTLTTAAQTGITSVGTLTGLTMGGTLAMGTNNITGTGNIGGTLTTAAQTGITSVGTLTSLTMSGALSGVTTIGASGVVTLSNTAQSSSISTGCLVLSGGLGISKNVYIGSTAVSSTAWGLTGIQYVSLATTYTDTSSSGTVASVVISAYAQPTIVANASTTFTNSATLFIANAPAAGTNVTLTNPYALWVAGGNVLFASNLTVASTITSQSTTLSTSASTGGIVTTGGLGIAKNMYIGGTSISTTAWGLTGIQTVSLATTYTDTSSSGTVASSVINGFAQSTIASSSATTFTNSSTIYIANAPAAGTNVTLTNSYAMWIANGKLLLGDTTHNSMSINNNQSLNISGATSINGSLYVNNINNAANQFVFGDFGTNKNGTNGTAGMMRFVTSGGICYLQAGLVNTAGSSADFFIGDWSQSTTISNRLFMIKSAGSVGIGTNTPNRQLAINSSVGNCLRLVYNSTSGAETAYCDQLVASTGTTSFVTAGTTGDINLTPLSGKVSFGTSAGANLSNITNDSSGNMSINGFTTNVRINNNLIVGNTAAGPNVLYFNGVTGDSSTNYCVIAERLYGASDFSEMLLFKGNDTGTAAGPDRIRMRAAELRFQIFQSVEDFTTIADNNTFVMISSQGVLQVGSAVTTTSWGTTGIQYNGIGTTYTDSSASGTRTNAHINTYAIPTIAASNTGVTITNAATMYLAGAPAAGTNVTITNPYSLITADGKVLFQHLAHAVNIKSTGSASAGIANIVFITDTTSWEVGARNSTNTPGNAYYIYNNSAYRFIIDSSGNIGIKGQTSPDAFLDFGNNASDRSLFIYNNTTSAYGFGANSNFLKYQSNGGHVWYTSSTSTAVGTEVMRIQSSGNVGINNNNPGFKFTVGTATASGYGIIHTDGTVNVGTYIDSTGGWIGTQTGHPMGFFASANVNNNITIQTGGNVSIGNTNNTYKLDVSGIINASTSLRSNLNSSSANFIGNWANSNFWGLGYDSNTTNTVQLTVCGTTGAPISYASLRCLSVYCTGTISVSTNSYAYFRSDNTTGSVGASTNNYSGYFSGRIACNGEINVISDYRMKENIIPLTNDYCKNFIQTTTPVEFDYKNDSDKQKHFGYIAQDVYKAGFTDLVALCTQDGLEEIIEEDGFTNPKDIAFVMSTTEMIPILAKNIKMLYDENEQLKRENEEIKERLLKIEQYLNM